MATNIQAEDLSIMELIYLDIHVASLKDQEDLSNPTAFSSSELPTRSTSLTQLQPLRQQTQQHKPPTNSGMQSTHSSVQTKLTSGRDAMDNLQSVDAVYTNTHTSLRGMDVLSTNPKYKGEYQIDIPNSFHDPTTFFPPPHSSVNLSMVAAYYETIQIAASVCVRVPVRDSTYALHQVVRKRSICIINAAI
ncbi:hypothetical protein PAAG_04560 [Paracoccidioides lutzii Pb01]|uniref:Uncharacterized protein n=1 Tax=Paracoccidioides lutzii (strain ATCC MYA-826 / Pb01) TaxID=502779 RepID=C1H1B6_PARBA|nr:hypothetical protein PAAG_04560 [Paracoccidioides lutzii Pb01]EEH33510.2 hypothetical protein PAAG_04560 [Paracoccidioides lutzii Pb01]